MIDKIKKGLRFLMMGLYIVALIFFLTLAARQVVLQLNLVQAAADPSTAVANDALPRLSRTLTTITFAAPVVGLILFILALRQPRRLWSISLAMLLLFFALNLYSGRHILPQIFVWPSPARLSTRYIQAVAADDLNTAIQLTDGSENCEMGTTLGFQRHHASLQRALAGEPASAIQSVEVRSIMTFYDAPLPDEFSLFLPVPMQKATIFVEMANGQTVWLTLKFSYRPFIGSRYICGEDI